MRTFFLIMFLFFGAFTEAIAQPNVVASIRPLQLIAAAITDGISAPRLVMDGSQDPHHPSLKPSQRQAIDQADLFIWIGPQLETGMERVVDELAVSVLTALELPGLKVYQINDSVDPHIWLDTRNAGIIAATLANTLVQLDPGNTDKYLENLGIFQENLHGSDQAISSILDTENFPPFAVYHNGYQYFERQFGFLHQASFTNNEEIQPGIRKVLEIKSVLAEKNVNCIVVDPSVNTENLNNQLERDQTRYITIDVLAHDITIAKDSYFRFMEKLAESFASCRG